MKRQFIPLFLATTSVSVMTAFWAGIFLTPTVLHEAAATSTLMGADFVMEEGQSAVSYEDLVEADVADFELYTESSPDAVRLRKPSSSYLLSVAGEPKLASGEIGVRVPVFMYHHIRYLPRTATAKERLYSVAPDVFEAQMEELVRAGYHTITPDELDQAMKTGYATLPTKPVLLTFDDGYKDQFAHAYPVLKRLGLKATFFIVTEAYKNRGSMTREMIQQVDREGLITIGAHTENHAFLNKIGASTRHQEIAGSKKSLEELLGHAVNTFAYPYGAWTDSIAQEVKDAGFTLAFWIRMGSLHGESSRFVLRRIRVLDGESLLPALEVFSATTTAPVTYSNLP